MALIVILTLFIVLGIAAARWGADTRDPDYSLRPAATDPRSTR